VCGTLKAPAIAHQELAAPNLAVETVARAIPDHTDCRLIQAVFCQHRRQVCMMMLNPDHGQPHRRGQPRRVIVWVHIASDHLGLHIKKLLVERQRIVVMLHGLDVLHVADVLAHKSVAIPRQSKGRLELRSHCEHRARHDR